MDAKHRSAQLVAALGVAVAGLLCLGAFARQKMDDFNVERARGILHDAHQAVKDHYYDLQFHGLDWDARFREYDEKIRSATSLSAAFGVVASFLDGLKDSHTFFRPPERPYHFDYGYRMEMVGDAAFVTQVRPGTDAESKVHPGDRVVGYNNFEVSRQNFHKLIYLFGGLAPLKATQLNLITTSGERRQVQIDASVKEQKLRWDLSSPAASFDLWQIIREEQNIGRLVRPRYHEVGDVMIWKLPEFFLSDSDVDNFFGIARKHGSLILDLRGNPGGAVITLERMLGNVFDHDVKVADRIGRKNELKPEVAKSRGGSGYGGKIMVLVDSESASASELFARTIQLEHRGIIIGDRTSGSVMEAKGFPFAEGIGTKIFYSFSVTEADLIMKDGKSLEHSGVTPDVIVLPTPDDLAAGRDPALSRAVELIGLDLDAAEAGKLFPYEWLPL
jgi:C-terminal processing protease CtpA/Prc